MFTIVDSLNSVYCTYQWRREHDLISLATLELTLTNRERNNNKVDLFPLWFVIYVCMGVCYSDILYLVVKLIITIFMMIIGPV